MACLAPMALFAKLENPPKAVMLLLIGIAGIYQIYFWGFFGPLSVLLWQSGLLRNLEQLGIGCIGLQGSWNASH
jgi:hypothetical protein